MVDPPAATEPDAVTAEEAKPPKKKRKWKLKLFVVTIVAAICTAVWYDTRKPKNHGRLDD